jgi:hypothetical protein
MATDIEQLVSQVRSLSPDEQRRIRQVLDEQLITSPPTQHQATEEDFKRRLLEVGLLKEIKPPVTDLGPYKNRQPFKIEGKPLSETIVEERR